MTEEFGLSDRELDILELLVEGASNKEIATRLVISTNTVKVHLRNIYSKLNVNSRTEAAFIALRNDLVHVEGIGLNDENGVDFDRLPRIGPFHLKAGFQKQSIRWYLTIGLVAILMVSIFGMLILLNGKGLGLGLGSTSENGIESQRWQTLSDLPTARAGLAVAAYENQIYVIGGETSSGISDFVERFDPVTNTWERLADKPTPVTEGDAIVIGGMIYVPGGKLETGESTKVHEAFNPITEEWNRLPSVPVAVSGYASVAFEGRLYLFGGWNGENYLNTVLSFDPQLNQWSEHTTLSVSRSYAGAEVSGGVIYVMGGINETGTLNLNEAYLPQREGTGEIPWQSRSPMPEARYAFGLASVADILHVLGGVGETEAPVPYKYFPQEDLWKAFSAFNNKPWTFMGVTAIESYLYVLGGRRGDRISAENLSYKAIYTIALPLVE